MAPGQYYNLMLKTNDLYGMVGYPSWEKYGTSPFLVPYYGFDFYYRPICLAFLFSAKHCPHPMDGVTDSMVMSKFCRILPDDSDPFISSAQEADIFSFR